MPPLVLPEGGIVDGVTTGHIAHHRRLHEFLNDVGAAIEFRRGVNFGTNVQAAGMSTAFAGAASDAQLVAARAAGVTDVFFVVFQYQANQTANAVAADATYTATDAAITHAVEYAQALGMRAALKPHVRCSDGSARATIHPTDPAAWFASYTAFITHYATLAQTLGCDMFVVGTEFASLQSTTLIALDTTNGSVNFTATAPVGAIPVLTSADVGKGIAILGAGTAGSCMVTTIASVTSATTGTLAFAASATLTKTGAVYGFGLGGRSNDTVATAANSRLVVGSATTWDQTRVGHTMVLKGAGYGGADLTSVVVQVTDATHLRIRDNATATLAATPSSMYATDKRWRQLITEVRAVFDGILTYAADVWETVTFWDALDVIGVDLYDLPAPANSSTAAQMLDGWRALTLSAGPTNAPVANDVVERIAKVQRRFQKPVIITETGVRNSAAAGFSFDFAANEAAGRSDATQAAYFESVLRLLAGLPWIKGLYWWWWTTDGADPGVITDYPFQGLAAEDTIAAWNKLPLPVMQGVGRASDLPSCAELRLGADVAIVTATPTTVTFTPTQDNDDIATASGAKPMILTPGEYSLDVGSVFATNVGGTFRRLELYRQIGGYPFGQSGGVQLLIGEDERPPGTVGLRTYLRVSRKIRFNAGDMLFAQVTHDLGGNLDLKTNGSPSEAWTFLNIARIGP